MSFGVLAPSAIAIDRVIRGRTSRRINLLFGPVIAIPMLLAYLVGGAFLNSGVIAALGIRHRSVHGNR